MNQLTKIMQSILLVGQLGVSLVTPPLVLLWLAHLAQTRLGWGAWTAAAAIVVGLVTGFCSVWRTLAPLLRTRAAEREAPKGRSFNEHI